MRAEEFAHVVGNADDDDGAVDEVVRECFNRVAYQWKQLSSSSDAIELVDDEDWLRRAQRCCRGPHGLGAGLTGEEVAECVVNVIVGEGRVGMVAEVPRCGDVDGLGDLLPDRSKGVVRGTVDTHGKSVGRHPRVCGADGRQ